MRFLPGNAQHIGARASQQDAFGFSDPGDPAFVAHGGMVALVADGMGGMAHGREASHAATRKFLEAYAAKPADEPIPQALRRALRAAHDAVLELAAQAGAAGEMGTTLAAVALCDDACSLISVGDSVVYLLRRGRLYRLTRPHTHGDNLDRDAARRLISDEEAAGDPERHALTSFLGIESLTEIDATEDPLLLQPGDRILLCSDGLTKALDDKQIAAGLSGDSQAAAERLVEKVLRKRRPDQDNVTVLVVACGDEQAREEAPVRGDPARRGAVAWQERPSRSALPPLKAVVPMVLALILLAWVLTRIACPGAEPPAAPPEAPADAGQMAPEPGSSGAGDLEEPVPETGTEEDEEPDGQDED